MNPEYFRLLYDYNAWANHHLLDACQTLSDEQFTRDLRSSFPSVRDTLAHIAGCEWLYLERFHGRSPASIPPGGEYRKLAGLRRKWAQTEGELLRFVGGLAPTDLERVIDYRNTQGTPYSNPLSALLQHLVNHGTYHRGQVTTMLRQLGAKAPTTDLIYFWREKPSGRPGAMIDPAVLRALYEYDAWANRRMLEACARLTPEQFTRELGSSFPSVRDTLAHILDAQWVWLERFHGRMPTAFPLSEEHRDLESRHARSTGLSKGLQDFTGNLSAEELQRNHEYRTFAGAVYANPLWVSLRHLVNHGTYHRGQVTSLLRQLGAETFSSDLIYFVRERAGLPLR